MKTRYKLLILLACIIAVPMILFSTIEVDLAFYASIFINLFLMCWGIEILANEASKHIDN